MTSLPNESLAFSRSAAREPFRSSPAMRFQLDRESRTPIYEQVREQLLSALHLGQIQAGVKLPSVRHFARVHQLNPKTVHRIYRRLHDEGYLDLRPGSGAYVAEVQQGHLDGEHLLNLHRFFRTSVAECQRMGIQPERAVRMFESYVTRDRLPAARVAVAECTPEHVSLLEQEIRARLGVQVVPTLIDSLERSHVPASLREVSLFLTTEHHLQEVAEFARSVGRQALHVRLHPDFLAALTDAAESGKLLMVVRSTAGWDSFLRASDLRRLSQEARDRIRTVAVDDPARVRQLAAEADTIYVSTQVRDRVARLLPLGKKILRVQQHLSMESMDLIEAALLFGTSSVLPPG